MFIVGIHIVFFRRGVMIDVFVWQGQAGDGRQPWEGVKGWAFLCSQIILFLIV